MMSNDLRTVRSNWTRLEGATLDGGFLLKQMIGADDISATFRTADHEVVKAYRLGGSAAEEQLQLWKQAKGFRHGNLIRVLGSGRTELEGEDAVFVALESTDESVADALRERALERNEAIELSRGVIAALEYLHSQGFVHGYLSPDTVYAVGETVKLSPEGIQPIGTNTGSELYRADLHRAKYITPEAHETMGPPADVWNLGATLYEALTQQDANEREEGSRAFLPAPFQTMIDRALDPDPNTRIALPEVRELLDHKPEAIPVAAAPAPEIGPAIAPASLAADASVGEHAPAALPTETTPIREPMVRDEEAPGRGLAKLIYGLIAIVVVAGLILVLRARSNGQRQQQAAAAQQQKQAAAQPEIAPPPQATTQQNKPSPIAPAPMVRHTNPALNAGPPAKTQGVNNIWRVIVYTYNGAAEAQRKAAAINAKHPGIEAAVFSPNEGTGPYLVVIGGQMTRDQARQLRQKAVRMGLPRDSYTQNYNR